MIRLRKCSLVIIILFGLFGCRTEYIYYTINNSTSHDILIEGFRRQTVSFVAADAIYVDPNSEFIISRLTGEDMDHREFFSIDDVDSVNVIFDEEKVLVLTCDSYPDFNCHPLVNGWHRDCTITEEDYNNAIPLDE